MSDPYFPPVNASNGRPICIAFTRSLPGQQRLGPREQINQNTAYLDSSQIYGQTVCESLSLRTFDRGLLNSTFRARGKHLLPQSINIPECKAASGYCFTAGDTRVSEQPGLASLHTLFMREHNQLASDLALVNPHWDDERLFQEARRIMTAQVQHIVYNEFLPRVLGWNAINLYELKLTADGYNNDYDQNCNAGILNEFATAAFRFGHSLIRPHLARMDTIYNERAPHIQLRHGFFNSDMLYENQMIDEIMRGLLSTPMENLDQFITGEITNHLFEERDIPFSGLDLAALNIQRGRDHGLPAYNEYRVICNLKRARTFEDLQREMNDKVINRLKQVYANVDDIDLFTGGLSETPLQGGLVGPTFGCIIGIQFRFLRKCDRFWYETSDPAVRFTEQQLTDIRKIILSKLVCRNCDVVDEIQRSVLDLPHQFLNPRVPCRSLPDINLNFWKEEPRCNVGGVQLGVGGVRRPSPCTSCTCTKDGPVCQSVRINNCQQLINEFGQSAVGNDNVCRVQCAFFFNQQQQQNRPSQFITPPNPQQQPTGQRSPRVQRPQPPPPPPPQPPQQQPNRPPPPPPPNRPRPGFGFNPQNFFSQLIQPFSRLTGIRFK